jgi:hypothetical protein
VQARLERIVRELQDVVRSAAPGSVSGDAALSLVALLAEAERAAASGIARLTPVVVEAGTFTKLGYASASDWLAALSGSSSAAAKGRLVAAGRAARSPELADALQGGDLSAPQLKVVTDAAAAAPEALATLLPLMAEGASHQELCDTATRLRAAARCRETARARRERVHDMRHLRWHQDQNGGIRFEGLCDEVAWSKILPGLESRAKERWQTAGEKRESIDAHRLDAFLELLSRPSGSVARPHTIVLIDAEALRRGSTVPGETCEIDGIGPISVDAAVELLGEGSVQFLVRTGRDVRTISSTSRTLPQQLEMALLVRDRICAVEGCGKRLGLEKDHCTVDFGMGGPTELENMVRLCGPHHAMKTDGGWKLVGPPEKRQWTAPANPPTAGRLARARKVAVAKANRIRD